MAIPAMATIIPVDGPAGPNSGSGTTAPRPPKYCCGSESRIGNPTNFTDNSCEVIRYTEKEDMRTDKGRILALDDIKKFKGKHIALWGSMPCT
eukprot:9378240-Pyramimonas_sp.AAC.1